MRQGKKIGKNFDDDIIKKVFEICRKYDILTGAFWLIGFPWETRQDIEKNYKLFNRFRCRSFFLRTCDSIS